MNSLDKPRRIVIEERPIIIVRHDGTETIATQIIVLEVEDFE
jgi:hypothetical protein